MRSQQARREGPEIDPIWLGSGCSRAGLDKPQILLESTYGDSHPGSRHLDRVVAACKDSCLEHGLRPSSYMVTDICDGVATGHDGMNYSLPSRDLISAMVEIHAQAVPFDAIVTFSSCDKSIPAHLMTHNRLNIPAIQVCGGSMEPGPGFISAEVCYATNDLVRAGRMSAAEEMHCKEAACPSGGACQYMGTASSMQVVAEALGMSLPGNALINPEGPLRHLAENAGEQIGRLLAKQITPQQIMTAKAFENAMILHAAVAGSTNILLHLPAIAAQSGLRMTLADFDHANRRIPVLCSLMTAGKWPTRLLWYAGGVPALMRELKNELNLDEMTVTGRTVGDNLYFLEEGGFFQQQEKYLANYNLTLRDVIHTTAVPVSSGGSIAVLHGNIAEQGAVVKQAAIDPALQCFCGRARPFNSEEMALQAIDNGQIQPGDIIIIRYEGPRGAGMPEMLKTTEKLINIPALAHCALITDGRFSGATKGPAIGHVSPEAVDGGAIALIEAGDLIRIDIPGRRLDLVGVDGEEKTLPEMAAILATRRAAYTPPPLSRKGGVLSLFSAIAGDAQQGASLFSFSPE